MKKLSTLLILLSTTGLLLAAPSTPITRGRLTTDLDAGGHSITNGPMATTNFVWDAVASVTNNLPQGGIDEEALRAIVASATNGVIRVDEYGLATVAGEIVVRDGITFTDAGGGNLNMQHGSVSALNGSFAGQVTTGDIVVNNKRLGTAAFASAFGLAASTNLPPLAASATVGDLVDSVNAIIGALHE